jgi:NAD(P)-dependent dehydrogenase (short-subunit alcohol dehydrogenase family)
MRGLGEQRVLVTGAARGIGAAICARLAEEGASVAGADLAMSGEDGSPVAARIEADVTDPGQVERMIGEARDALGGLDGLVLAAGVHWTGPTHEMAPEEFDRVVRVGAHGTFLCCSAALPGMLEQRRGSIVTPGSTAGLAGAAELTAYAAAKGAVLQITRSIAVEYASRGIRANCLCPGATRTQLLESLMAERSDPDEFARAHPIGRFAEPAEIAAAAAFLLSDESSFFVGSTMVCDGGFTA